MKLLINPKAPPSMVAEAQEFYDATRGFLEVKANQQWNRFSTERGNSAYFLLRLDGRYEVTIEGNSYLRHQATATFHWGKPHRTYIGPNGEQAGFWRMQKNVLFETANAVLTDTRELPNDSKIIEEVDSILADPNLAGEDKEVLAKQRIGHSRFAKDVKAKAQNRCMVKPAITRNLIAAHIKPWSLCNPEEKTDIGNGLCLSPDMDGLFESGEISFRDTGQILIGNLNKVELSAYGLTGNEVISISDGHRSYLAWHRNFKYLECS